ncbi:MAG TPA: hypothetical protein VHB45_00155 [Alloacidobacterium sp.]|nr:hypothetical protein [Alloacidobacterium sp.]
MKQSILTRSAVYASLLAIAIIGTANFGPGNGIPCPIGRGGNGIIARASFGPGNGIPCPIGRGGTRA